MFHIRSFKF